MISLLLLCSMLRRSIARLPKVVIIEHSAAIKYRVYKERIFSVCKEKMSEKREKLRRVAVETLKILENGSYDLENNRISIKEDLESAISDTVHYQPTCLKQLLKKFEEDYQNIPRDDPTIFEVTQETSLEACHRLVKLEGFENVACLNFASAKNAGGGFINGSHTQEESLARASGLYPCLMSCPNYYETHRKQKPNTGLYTDNMIYAKGVPVIRGNNDQLLSKPYSIDIITTPACNAGVARRNPNWEARIDNIMKTRVGYILAAAEEKKVDVLVLGAWGCGVFKNDPESIASHFKYWLGSENSKFANVFQKIVFAVYGNNDTDPNLLAFQKEFKN